MAEEKKQDQKEKAKADEEKGGKGITKNSSKKTKDKIKVLEKELEEKEKLLREKEAEKEQVLEKLQRAKADFANYKKRVEKARFQDKIRAQEEIILELLPVLDNFERALAVEFSSKEVEKFGQGVDMIFKQIKKILAQKGLEEIPAEGKPFDPQIHEAVERVYDENKGEDIVVEVIQKGYKIDDRVLRPSMVKVNKGGDRDEQNSGD